MKNIACLIICLTIAACSSVQAPDGYRMNKYKAPVPDHVPGGDIVLVEEAALLKDKGASFVDVIGSGKRLTKTVTGDWLVVTPHKSIPGSIWLPDVGRGALTANQTRYFKQNLEKISKGNKDHPMVFFCIRDCWMSWNATKRAATYGYTNLYWLPDGKDGWQENGREILQIYPSKLQ